MGRDHPVRCLPSEVVVHRLAELLLAGGKAQLSEPMRVQVETQFAQVLRPPDGIT